MTKRFTTLVTSFAFAAWLVTGVARADSTCTALISNIANTANTYNVEYIVEMTTHRFDVDWVSYSSGQIGPTHDVTWPLSGQSNQLFSDRLSGSQPFDVNRADQLYFQISSSGVLYIYNVTWHFPISWDMSCTGNALTKIIPGFGVVTFTFRNWFYPIQ